MNKDQINIKRLQNVLASKYEIRYFPKLASTNKLGLELAKQGFSKDLLILAEEQTAGYGRYKRKFYSPPGSGIYLSLVSKSYPSLTSIAPIAALAAQRACQLETGHKVKIKWVNDLYFEGKKIAGILPEAVRTKGQTEPEAIVLGLGLNVYPPQLVSELDKQIGSLVKSPSPGLRTKLILAFLQHWEELRQEQDTQTAFTAYQKLELLQGQRVLISTVTSSFYAQVIGISPAYELVVKTEQGELQKLSSASITEFRA